MPVNASKRLYTQSVSDCVSEPVQVNTVVIIHPGSLNLRVGRASDTFPVTVKHCIARKRKPNVPEYATPWMVRAETQHSGAKQQKDIAYKAAIHALETKPMESGEERPSSSVKQLHANNVRVKGERTDVICPQKWTRTESQPAYVVGDEATLVHPAAGYSLHWPIKGGHLNLHDRPGGTLNAVMADMELIWGYAIQTQLDIPLKDLKYYKALLLIPDVYTHKHVREMVNMLLSTLGFGAVIAQQESVCALFGTGMQSACVVDVGDQKTSISCVEDGISHRGSRITMEIGGCDVTRTFCEMLTTLGFQPRGVAISNLTDALLYQGLKENLCHFDYNRYGYLEESIQIKKPEQPILKYFIQIGDELVLAPLSLFFPDMYGLQGGHLVRGQRRNEGDPADPHDEFYLRQVQRGQQDPMAKSSKKKESGDTTRDGPDLGLDDSNLNALQDDDSNDAPDTLPMADGGKLTRRELEEEEEEDVEPLAQLMGIDQAILHCIDKCGSDETKKKMYSCIVVVGGGLNFEGVQPWLQYRVWMGMPAQYRVMLETMDVITRPKEMEPQYVVWKGAAIMACLDSTNELWIRQNEWQQFDVRLLRERAPFVW